MLESKNRLLVVDDEPDILDFIAEVASGMGFEVAQAQSSKQFMAQLDEFDPTVLMLDLQLPQTDGVELLRRLVRRRCKLPVLLISGVDRKVMSTTERLGISGGLSMLGILQKPILIEHLESKLAEAFQESKAIDATELKRGLDGQQMIAYFQPKAFLDSDGNWVIEGVEALVRWQHPRLGLVMPADFIELAERSGLIGQLTEQVLEQSVTQMRAWMDEGLALKCAVNLPPSLVNDLAFPDRLAQLCRRYDVPESHLTLEITETTAMENPTLTMDILTRLRVKGISLSLDDFGTGYSSLTQLYQMPFDELKIDRSLVMDIPRSREANTMVGSLIELGHNLGLRVCAEGVERRAALDLLATLGCDSCQGFFISKPIPAAEIAATVAGWNQARQGPADKKPMAG